MVGGLAGTDRYFRTVGVFSHFGIGGKWGADAAAGLDGVVYQWGDTARRAAASLDGNRRTISVETADNAARPIQPWTDKQCNAIVGIMVWAHRTHGIPLVLIPDSKPGRTGIGYHRLGCDPYRVDGGELWSSSWGKDCPTDARIRQIPGLIDRARAIVAGHQEEKDMPLNDDDKAWLRSLTGAGGGTTVVGVTQDTYNRVHAELTEARAAVDELRGSVEELRVLVDARLPEPTEPTA